MGLEQDIALLSQLELFEGFSNEQLRLLAFGAAKRELSVGDTLFRENALTDGGYVIVSGQVDLVRSKGDDTELVETLGPGSLVGELALITETRRMTTAIASQPTELLRVPRVLFRRVLEEFPELAALLHQRISKNVEDLVGSLESVGKKLDGSPL